MSRKVSLPTAGSASKKAQSGSAVGSERSYLKKAGLESVPVAVRRRSSDFGAVRPGDRSGRISRGGGIPRFFFCPLDPLIRFDPLDPLLYSINLSNPLPCQNCTPVTSSPPDKSGGIPSRDSGTCRRLASILRITRIITLALRGVTLPFLPGSCPESTERSGDDV